MTCEAIFARPCPVPIQPPRRRRRRADPTVVISLMIASLWVGAAADAVPRWACASQ